MSTQRLDLLYRPRTFDDLAGQPHVATVLTSTVRAHRADEGAPTTYVFSGPTGTGKTSTARMLAAALNSPDDYDWDPAAIVEVDAATRNTIDDVRALVQSAGYVPTARHRTFVLDECHALSEAAWQALLKGLEQPPPSTTWILVTTEANKVPDAVLGRSMDLAFRPVVTEAVVARLVTICQAEGIGAEVEALELIAHRAAGGLRDAIRDLDKLRYSGPVTVATYEAVYGIGRAAASYLLALRSGDLVGALRIGTAYVGGTGSPELLVDECLEYLTDRLTDSPDPRRIVAACRVLWESRQRIRSQPIGAKAALGALTAELVHALGAEPQHIQGASEAAPVLDLAAALGVAAQ